MGNYILAKIGELLVSRKINTTTQAKTSPQPDFKAILAQDTIHHRDGIKLLSLLEEENGKAIYREAAKDCGFRLEEADGILVSRYKELAIGLQLNQSTITRRIKDSHLRPPKLKDFSPAGQSRLILAFAIKHPNSELVFLDWKCFIIGTLLSDTTKKYIIATLSGTPLDKAHELNITDKAIDVTTDATTHNTINSYKWDSLFEFMHVCLSAKIPRPHKEHAAGLDAQDKEEVFEHLNPNREDQENAQKGEVTMCYQQDNNPPTTSLAIILNKENLSYGDMQELLRLIDEKTGNIAYKKAAEYFGFKVIEIEGKVLSTAKELAQAFNKTEDAILKQIRRSNCQPIPMEGFGQNVRSLLRKKFNLSSSDFSTKLIEWR